MRSAGFRNLALIMGLGMFASTFAQAGVLGLYPFRFLLKDQLHEGPFRVAMFMQIAAMPWNLKIIAGIICDGLPVFGSRRRYSCFIISVWNWGLLCSDLLGSALYEHGRFSFKQLVWINATATMIVLVAVPFLPKLLVDRREEDPAPGLR